MPLSSARALTTLATSVLASCSLLLGTVTTAPTTAAATPLGIIPAGYETVHVTKKPIGKKDKLTVETLVTPRSEYTQKAILLMDDPDEYVMLAGIHTKPADLAKARAIPGYNPWLHPVPEGDAPDFDDLDLSEGYSPEKLLTLYKSDVPPKINYVELLSGFPTAIANKEVARQNREITLAVNNNASKVQIQRAVEDSDDENIVTMSDAMGGKLGAIFRDCYNSGKLPKLHQLIGGNISRAFHFMNATGMEKFYYHNPRPFAVAKERVKYYYEDLDDAAEDEGYRSLIWSFPSGHTNRSYIKGVILATLLPEIAPQLMARASEVGYNRLVMGVHYPLDVIGGRMSGTASMAQHWGDVRFRPLFYEAMQEVRGKLEKECGTTIARCAQEGLQWLSVAESVRVYTERMTYGLPRIGEAGRPLMVPAHAEDLLRTKFPKLTPKQRRQVLIATSLDSGYPMDIEGSEGGWQRLNYAKAFAARVQVQDDGALIISYPR